MAKNLKINIKNTQIAKAINLGSLKDKLAKKKESVEEAEKAPDIKEAKRSATPSTTLPPSEEAPRIKARSKSAFAETGSPETKAKSATQPHKPSPLIEEIVSEVETLKEESITELKRKGRADKLKTSEELRQELFGEEIAEQAKQKETEALPSKFFEEKAPEEKVEPPLSPVTTSEVKEEKLPKGIASSPSPEQEQPITVATEYVKLGPTGRHIKDLLPPPKPKAKLETKEEIYPLPIKAPVTPVETAESLKEKGKLKAKGRVKEEGEKVSISVEEEEAKKGQKATKFKEFRDIKPTRRTDTQKGFDVRDRHGLRETEEENRVWRKKRSAKARPVQEDITIRPTSLKVQIPITIKDLAAKISKSSRFLYFNSPHARRMIEMP